MTSNSKTDKLVALLDVYKSAKNKCFLHINYLKTFFFYVCKGMNSCLIIQIFLNFFMLFYRLATSSFLVSILVERVKMREGTSVGNQRVMSAVWKACLFALERYAFHFGKVCFSRWKGMLSKFDIIVIRNHIKIRRFIISKKLLSYVGDFG